VYIVSVMNTKEKKILGSVSIFHLFNDASVVALPTIYPILYTQGLLIKKYADIGTMMLIGLVVSIVFHFFVGHWAKGRHYRLLLVLDDLVVGLFLLLTPLAGNYTLLVLTYVGVRIGSSIYHPVGISWVTHTFRGKNLDRAMGIQSAFGDVGVLAAFLGTGFLAQLFGWTDPLYLWGGLCIAAALAGLVVSRGTGEGGDFAAEEEDRVSWRETFHDQKFLIPPALLSGLSWGITLAYGPSLLNHKLGASMSLTGVVLGCWIGAGILGSLLYGRVAKRIGRYGAIILGCTLTAVSTCILAFNTSIPVAAVLLAFFGWSLFLTFPALLTLVGSVAKPKNRTAAFSLNANVQIFGNAAFTFVAGFMSDAWGINTPFLLLGCVALVIAVYTIALRKRFAGFGATAAPAVPGEIAP
jgi:MFS transporter, FSR family, fosmidomycin resistance protein